MIVWIVIGLVAQITECLGQYQSSCWSENATTVAGSPTGSSGSTVSLLNTNLGIYLTDATELFIADSGNNRIIFSDLNHFPSPTIFGNGTPSMGQPADVFVTNTSVYIMDKGNYRVLRYWKNGTNPVVVAGITGSLGSAASLTQLALSYFIFVDKNGRLFVSDTNNHRILLFPSNTTSGTSALVVAGTGTGGPAANQLNNPNGIFVRDDGTLYIADLRNNRIQKWSANATAGQLVAGDGTAGNSSSQIYFPTSVVVDSDEFIYVTELRNARVTRWASQSSTGVCIAGCSTNAGSAPNQLRSPQKLTFDQNGSLYVSDQANHRVQKFTRIENCGQ